MQQYNTPTPPPKKSKKTLWIVLGVLLLAIIMCICSIAVFAPKASPALAPENTSPTNTVTVKNTPTKSATAAVKIEATNTSAIIPTQKIVPTEKPIIPKATAKAVAPTPTPTTAAAPVPVPTQAPISTPIPTQALSGCSPRSAAGNCYEPGQFCPERDAGMIGTDAEGSPIKCELVSGRYHWEAA